MRDNIGYIGGVNKYSIIGSGGFSDVYQCDYLDMIFAYKDFWNPKYIEFINDKIKRISEFYELNSEYLYPYKLIYKKPDDKLFLGYLLDYMYEYKSLDNFKDIELLKRCRDIIEKFHKETGCIHTDITPWNIHYNLTLDKLKLIDFDTNISLKDKDVIDLRKYNIMATEYLNNIGVDKGLDMFMFNLTVFSILNKVSFFEVLERIQNGNYGIFEDNESVKKIFDSYKDFSCKKSLKKEYIIDYM